MIQGRSRRSGPALRLRAGFVLCVFCIGWPGRPESARAAPPPAQPPRLTAAIARLRSVYGEGAAIEWAGGGGGVRRMTGLLGGSFPGAPAAAVASFRDQNRDLLSGSGERPLAGSFAIGGATVLRYGRTWQGLPVFGGAEIFHVDARNCVRFYFGDVRPDVEIETKPRIAVEDAEAIVLAALPAGPDWRTAGAELGIVPPSDGRAAFLAWRIDATATCPLGARSAYVSAADGEIISIHDRLRSAGVGNAYAENPWTGALIAVDLTPIGTSGYLEGPYAVVMDWVRTPRYSHPLGELRAQADANGDFLFAASDDRTAEVNAYHHINRIHALFAGLDFHGLDRTFPAIVNVEKCDLTGEGIPETCDNAYFHPLYPYEGRLGGFFFGKTSRGSYALDADVVGHEYTHAVVAATAELGDVARPDEAFYPVSLDEGFADYFACSLAGNPLLAEYAGRIYGGGAGSGPIRNVSNDARFPDDVTSDPHETGLIWSGGCWQLREDLVDLVAEEGAHRADRLVFAALVSLTPSADLGDAAAALVASAQSIEGAAFADLARRILNRRGLISAAATLQGPSESGETLTGIAEPSSVSLLAIPQYTIDVGADAATLRITLEADRDLDLYGRLGWRLTSAGSSVTADHASETPSIGDEQLVIERSGSPALQDGRYYFAIANRTDAAAMYTISFRIEESPAAPFIRGDLDGSGQLEIGDAIQVLEYLYMGRILACPKSADANDSGLVDLADAVYLLNFIFASGSAPPPPYPERGADPTPDLLPCEG
ncbi:MAG: hypothetical protein JXP34_10905 [Planctomycetes bacterium]|nr:hypothetical protein [Planctomycetota bacterium]